MTNSIKISSVIKWLFIVFILTTPEVAIIAGPHGAGSSGGGGSSSGSGGSDGGSSQAGGGSGAGSPSSGQSSPSGSLGGTILAYRSLRELGQKIGCEIAQYNKTNDFSPNPEKKIEKVYITTVAPNIGQAQASYFYLKYSIGSFISTYRNQKPFVSDAHLDDLQKNITLAGPDTLADLANAASTLLSLFRTTLTSSDSQVPSDNLGFLPDLCTTLIHSNIKPLTGDIVVNAQVLYEQDSLVNSLAYLAKIRAAAGNYVATPPQIPTTGNAADDAKNKDIQKQKLSTLNAINMNVDNLFTNMIAQQQIAGLIQVDLIMSILSQKKTSLLYVTNNYAIGDMRTKANPILDIFLDGARISYAGGAGVTYFLYSGTDMTPVLAGHLDGYINYRRFNKSAWPKVPNDLDKTSKK